MVYNLVCFRPGISVDDIQNPWECYMGSFSEEPPTLENAGTQHRRGRLGSYGGVGLEKLWYVVPSFYTFLCFICNLEGRHANVSLRI